MEIELICKICGEPREKGRGLCRKCNAQRSKKYYDKEKYIKKRTKQCPHCKEDKYFSRAKEQIVCPDCRLLILSCEMRANNNYLYDNKARPVHRVIAESLLNRKLKYNEVIHHINENPKDNELSNLIILSRKSHGKLHAFLRRQRVIWEQSQNENPENCWEDLRVLQTTAWLEMTNAKVIKLEELVNQQPSA